MKVLNPIVAVIYTRITCKVRKFTQLGLKIRVTQRKKSRKLSSLAARHLVFFFKIKDKLVKYINKKVLILKAFLVSILSIVAILSLPILLDKGNTHFKHALEWNYFVGVISFYLLSRFFWRRTV